jgi:hypothetical protein
MALSVSPDTAQQKEIAFGAAGKELQHNNGMHPTASSAALIRETEVLMR